MKYPWNEPKLCKHGHIAKRNKQRSCVECRREHNIEWRSENRAKSLISSAKNRATKKGLPFDLDQHVGYFKRTLEIGKCQLTGISFDLNTARSRVANPFAPSLDRIKPELGYVKNNVRIILWALNVGFSSWGIEKYQEIAYALTRETIDTVKALQADMLFAVKHTAILVRSSNSSLRMVVNIERGSDIPSGVCTFTDGTTIEFQDIGMPQPGVPTMTAQELGKAVFSKVTELGLEIV